MSDAGRLAGFGLVLAVALLAGLGLGSAVGPLDQTPPQDTNTTHPMDAKDQS